MSRRFMSVLISVPIGMAINQYSNLNHTCDIVMPHSLLGVEIVLVQRLVQRRHFKYKPISE